jgi:hypothetical protein
MAVSSGTYNDTLQRRADWSRTLEFLDENDEPISLIGWTAAAQAWDKERTVKYADFTISYIDRSLGKIKISVGKAVTATFPDEIYFDVAMTDPNGFKDYYLEGILYVSEGYTE